MYNGKDRVHGYKYQGLSAPDGIMLQMWGPFPGRRHDVAMLRESGLLALLREVFPEFGIYGDPAYPLSFILVRPFRGAAVLPEAEASFNTEMSSVRESVEWGFGMLTNTWQSFSFTRKEKMLERPLALYYQVATLLMNCRTCMRGGNITSTYFNLAPPSLEQYLMQ